MNKIKCDSIIFDMDGVLIDETESCRMAIIKTVNYYLRRIGSKNKIFTTQVNKIKSVLGFNDDHDASFMIIELISKNIVTNNYTKFAKPLSDRVRKTAKYKFIEDIWQMYYLGSILFEETKGKKPLWKNEKGLIYKEKLLISKQVLEKLAKTYYLAIATGRPKWEAEFAISIFGLERYFGMEFVVCKEDSKFLKPNPAPLNEAKKRLGTKKPIYVGDTINDVIAAKKAGIVSVFVGVEKHGDYQIKEVNELEGILYAKA